MLRTARAVAALLAASAVAVVVLVAARPALVGNPAEWSGDDLARSAAWLAACACTVWLAFTTLACAAAQARGDLARAMGITRWAPPVARGVLRTALAGALTLAPAPASADPASPPPVTLHAGTDGHLVPGPGRKPPPRPAAPTPVRRPPPSSPSARRERVHVVRAGDNLWAIARAEVARATGRADPDDHTIAPYWRRVIAANRATLRSGDPSLIYPGEIVTLPHPLP